MFNGSVAKFIASFATYPFQVIKSRLQQGDSMLPRGGLLRPLDPPKYSGTVDCALKILRYEGMAGYYRGVFPYAVRSAPSAGITFLVYEETARLLRNRRALS